VIWNFRDFGIGTFDDNRRHIKYSHNEIISGHVKGMEQTSVAAMNLLALFLVIA